MVNFRKVGAMWINCDSAINYPSQFNLTWEDQYVMAVKIDLGEYL